MNYYVFHVYMVGEYSPIRDSAWEENIRIYQEESVEIAKARASHDARAGQVEYKTSDGYIISWKVHSVIMVKEIDMNDMDGAEVFSRSLTDSEAQSLLNKIE